MVAAIVLPKIGYSRGCVWEKYLYDVLIHIIALRRAVRKKLSLSRCPERAAGLGWMKWEHSPLSPVRGGVTVGNYILKRKGGDKNGE